MTDRILFISACMLIIAVALFAAAGILFLKTGSGSPMPGGVPGQHPGGSIGPSDQNGPQEGREQVQKTQEKCPMGGQNQECHCPDQRINQENKGKPVKEENRETAWMKDHNPRMEEQNQPASGDDHQMKGNECPMNQHSSRQGQEEGQQMRSGEKRMGTTHETTPIVLVLIAKN